jgi:hypothetical protein
MLPDEEAFMSRLDTKLLFRLDLDIGYSQMQSIGTTTAGRRIVAPVDGGRFVGERLRGTVLPGGADWVTFRSDGAMMIDVRFTLKTDDDALILMFYQGIAHAPPEVMAAFNQRQVVPVASVYARTTPRFETAAPRYDWLNRIVAVSKGCRTAAGPMYNVFEIL